ncbi:MAG: histidine phosphatase family protein [Ornithinibacter sp.]
MPVTLVRHTTPIGGAARCYGRTDLDIDPDEVAKVAAGLVADLHPGFGRIVSSPLRRALSLSELIAKLLGRDVVVDDRFAEMDFGAWEGVPWDEVPRADLDAWAANLLGFRGHGGESVGDLAKRVAHGLRDLGEEDLVVCHLGVIRAALAARGAAEPWTASVPFGGVVVLPDDARPRPLE